ncbi:MAG: ribosome small subunit-dependent GTPase A [Thermoplasmatota archaeon]
MLDLRELGWNDAFQYQLDELNLGNVMTGRINRVDRTEYGVLTTEGELSARLAGRLKAFSESKDLPAVGDWVLLKYVGNTLNIFYILDRTSTISRKVPGNVVREQMVAANVDVVFIVMGLDDDFNLRRLERYLMMVSGSGCHPVVILNKSDLIDEDSGKLEQIRQMEIGADVHVISAWDRKGLELLRPYLRKGITATLVGSSGAGKSTIINALLGEQRQRTGEVRESDSRGRHITTRRELFLLPRGGMLIDNPGIRELQLWGEATDLDNAFPDIARLASNCRYRDCSHDTEPRCAVRKALEEGHISRERYNNYKKMKKELAVLQEKMDKGGESFQRERWKTIHKGIKSYYKYKEEGR